MDHLDRTSILYHTELLSSQPHQVDEVLATYSHASRPPAHHAKGKAAGAGEGGEKATGEGAALSGVLRKLEDVRRRGRKRDMFG